MGSIGSVREFYSGKTIFITGGSGFMGKVLIEKLLYSCSDLSKIYILMREKKGKSGAERAAEFSKVPIFRRILNEKPEVLEKLVPVYGDILSVNLGLSVEDHDRVINDTNIVFHMAATVNFEAPLKTAVEMNIRGVKYVMDLAKKMTKLDVILHLSTAFCCVDQEILEEEIYEWNLNPRNLIACTEWMSEEMMDNMCKGLIQKHPNTYTFTKRLAELLVRDEYPNLPVCIVRPSIVVASFLEPIPGWVDNLNGPVALFLGSGKGIIRSILCNIDHPVEALPVDLAINVLVMIPWDFVREKQKPKTIPVINLTVPRNLRQTWGFFAETMRSVFNDFPFEAGIWYPGGATTKNPIFHYTRVFFTQWIPALLVDAICILLRRRPFLVRLQKKIFVGSKMLQYFSMRKWEFNVSKAIAIEEKLSPEEKKIFYFNIDPPDFKLYAQNCILSSREFILKESPSTLPKARMQLKVLKAIDILNSIFWIISFGWIVKALLQRFF